MTDEDKAKLVDTRLGRLIKMLEDAAPDYLKGLGGVRQPGVRVRKVAMDAKELLLAIRKEMLDSRPKD
jgi:hypothetical protein